MAVRGPPAEEFRQQVFMVFVCVHCVHKLKRNVTHVQVECYKRQTEADSMQMQMKLFFTTMMQIVVSKPLMCAYEYKVQSIII